MDLDLIYKEIDKYINKVTFKPKKYDKQMISTYFYNFENEELNRFFYEHLKKYKTKTIFKIISIFGKFMILPLFFDNGLYAVSKKYIKNTSNTYIMNEVKKLLKYWEIEKGNNLKKEASKYDFDGLYNKIKIRGYGIYISPKKLKDHYNDIIPFDTFENFVSYFKELIKDIKAKRKKKSKVVDLKKYEETFDVVKNIIEYKEEIGEIKKFSDFFSDAPTDIALEKIVEEVLYNIELEELRYTYIPLKNVIELEKEIKRIEDKIIEFECSTKDYTYEIYSLNKKLNKLKRDWNLYNFDERNVVTLRGKSYVKVSVNDHFAESVGRNYNKIASTSKAGRKILFSHGVSIDISNMAGKSIYEVLKYFNLEKEYPLFCEFATDRDNYFNRFETKIPKDLKKQILKVAHLSMMFGRNFEVLLKTFSNNTLAHVRQFKKDFLNIVIDYANSNGITEKEEISELFKKSYKMIIFNLPLLNSFYNETLRIAKELSEKIHKKKTKKRESFSNLSKLFMNIESDIIEDIIKNSNYKYLRPERIHDEIIVFEYDPKTFSYIYNVFSSNIFKKFGLVIPLRNFQSSITFIDTGHKIKFSNLNKHITELDENILKSFLSISKTDLKYLKKSKKYYNKMFINFDNDDIKELLTDIKNGKQKIKRKYFKRILRPLKLKRILKLVNQKRKNFKSSINKLKNYFELFKYVYNVKVSYGYFKFEYG